MNLTMRVCPHLWIGLRLDATMRVDFGLIDNDTLAHNSVFLEILGRHDNHGNFFLLGVEVLHNTVVDQALPSEDLRLAVFFADALE
jgi:hypothetical protein